MKKITLLSIVVILAGTCIGFGFRQSAKDAGIMGIRNIEDVRALDCNVNSIFCADEVDLYLAGCKKAFDALPEDVEIYVVAPTGVMAQHNFSLLQEAEVREVLKGRGAPNDLIQIVAEGGFYDQKYSLEVFPNERPVYYGMMNVLFCDNEYLVFLRPLKINAYTEERRYHLAMPLFGTFNLTSDHSTPIDGPVSELHYNDFGDSEYLCDTAETLEALLEWKHSVIEKFLGDWRGRR